MANRKKGAKDETVIFRVSKDVVELLDKLAEMIGASRSEALRRLIPDLSRKEKK